jgi:putative phosphoesterase
MRIGVISDTHNLLRPEAVGTLKGCAAILHAGDICEPGILKQLAQIAPVSAVRGNNDRGAWARRIPVTRRFELGGLQVYMIHNLKELAIDPAKQGIAVVVSGHSHIPKVTRKDGVLYLNPGAAGPRRFKLPITLAYLEIRHGKPSARIVSL